MLSAVALCAVGAEKTVSNELRKLNFKVTEGRYGHVRFISDAEGLYRALVGLRAVDRILLEIALFEALDFDDLFEGTKQLEWENFIPPRLGLRVTKVRTNRSVLKAQSSIQAVVHKAAAERLCKKRGINRLPTVEGNEAELRVYIEKNQVSLLLDLSGEPLYKRGYRTMGGIAPLRETTAAAIILLSGWRRKFPLYDPFCGSGTIAIEAAMYAWDIAPGIGRRFALDRLSLGSRETEKKVRQDFLGKVDFSRLVRIRGSDSDSASIAAARENLSRALDLTEGKGSSLQLNLPPGGQTVIDASFFRVLPMEEAEFKTEPGFIITNPPYGRRLGDAESAAKIYSGIGKLGRNFPGWKLFLISDTSGFESFFGRKADFCREITNGAINSYLYHYEKLL